MTLKLKFTRNCTPIMRFNLLQLDNESMKNIPGAILGFSAALVVQLILIIVFVSLQLTMDPQELPQEFSIITGGERQIRHSEEVCDSVELNTLTPNIRTTAYIHLSRSSTVVSNENLEQIFVNNILKVGYDSNQLTYYGIPVARNDELRLNLSSSDNTLDSLSVTISVYEVEGFSQLLEYISQNADPLSRYDLHSCLLGSGCVVNLEAEFTGWLYLVFDSTPTPSALIVSLEAVVREYDLDSIDIASECTLSEITPSCHLVVPTHVYDEDGIKTDANDFPFSIIYRTASLLSNPPPSQALNVSVDLTSTCVRTYSFAYIVLIPISGVTSIITFFVLMVLVWIHYGSPKPSLVIPSVNCCRDINPRRRCVRDTELGEGPPSPTLNKSDDMNLPSYEKVIKEGYL